MNRIIIFFIFQILIFSVFFSGCIQKDYKSHKNEEIETFPFIDEGMENITITDVGWKPNSQYAILIGYYNIFEGNYNATILQYDGNNFICIPTNITLKYGEESFKLTKRMGHLNRIVWSPMGEYALIVGNGGVVLIYDAKDLKEISGISYDYDLYDISWNPKDNCFYIIGNDVGYPYPGALWKFDGCNISMITADLGTKLTSIEWKPNGSYALIVGDDIIVKYDEKKLTVYEEDEIGISINCNRVEWRHNGSQATIIGSYGKIIEFNGTNFTAIPINEDYLFNGIDWNSKNDYAFIVGNYNGYFGKTLILKYKSNGILEKVHIS